MDISVRDLKANLSGFIQRVAAGETATITSHRKPVARLVPPPPTGEDAVSRLLAADVISHKPRPLGLGPRLLLPLPPIMGSLSAAVIEDRG